jgi:sugar transferase (PEP-CTERM/EpsH1 system associated)
MAAGTKIDLLRSDVALRTASVHERRERLRILHVVSRLGMGGTENGVLKVIKGLGDEDFDHRICAVRGIDIDFATRTNLLERSCSAGRPQPGFQFPLFRLSNIMRKYRPHVVHSRNFGALEAVLAARFAGVPVVIHSEHGYEIETQSGLPLRRRALCRALYPLADVVFTVSSELRSYHSRQSWLQRGHFRVIFNGVDIERFAPRPQMSARVRRDLGISADRLVIGSVGRLVPIKDHQTLLRGSELLLQAGRNIHVVLVGAGTEQARLQEYAASGALNGRVTFTGASESVPELLSAMDIFVLPSISEGMSNTILEAMASGLPILATRAGGNMELIEHGSGGLLFAPGDVQALRSHLEQLIDDSEMRRELGNAARGRVVAEFSLDRMIQNYRDLYLQLAAQRDIHRAHEAA